MIKDQQLSDFLREISSKSPTPGGGAVAAIVIALATSLCEMVINLTLGKKGYEKETMNLSLKAKSLIKIKDYSLKLADEDVEAFNQVMSAYKSKDQKRIQLALKKAIEIPLETYKLAEEISKIALWLSKRGNRNAFSDSKTALYLAKAAKLSALENIKINLKFLKDEAWKVKILLKVKA